MIVAKNAETPTDLPTGRGVQSVEVAGRILSVLADSTKPMMLRDIADAAGLPPGQAHPYIVSFLYRLGWFALHLGLARLRGFDPYQLASETIADLAQSLDLGVAISVWGTYGPTVIRSIESPHNITTNSKPGTVLGLTGTATGKIWAAFLPQQLASKRIAAELKGKPAGVGLKELEQELVDIRDAGYASTDGNPWPGIAAACAPVFDYTGQIQLAVALLGPSAALDCAPDSPQVTALLSFTRGLSAQLGYRETTSPEGRNIE
jgi:DNA-binding IclR family transcriptional regulator